MKFSVAALPILALFTQQAVGVALPLSDDMSAELKARHHMPNGRGGQGQFGNKNGGGNRFGNGFGNGGGNKNTGGNTTTGGNKGTGTGAGTGGGNGNKGGNNTTATSTSASVVGSSTLSSSSVAASSTSTTSTLSNTTSTVATGTSTNGTNSGLSAAQIAALQSSLTLDLSQVMPGLGQDGQETPEAGQVPSLTSFNNFINYCATQTGVPLTNGKQIKTGSCNPTPMGRIVQTDKMSSTKFTNPPNFSSSLKKNETFTISMNIKNMVTGNFVNAQANYYAAPGQVSSDGTPIGHTHFVIQQVASFTDPTPPDPTVFSFFIGVNGADQGGVLTANVANGLLAGSYRLCSITTYSNHQPILGAVAQHGNFDDCVYFSVSN